MASREDSRSERKLTECLKKLGLDARAAENVFLELCTVFAGPKKSREVKQAIKELKKCVNSDSGDVFNKLSFAINFASKIAAIHPIPATLGTTFSVLSNLFLQVGNAMKTTVPSADKDSAYAAIERFQDSELKAEAVGLEDLFYNTNAYLNSFEEDAPKSIINHLEDKFPTNDAVRFLGKLRAKTEELLYSDIKSAYRAAAYINLYSRLAILRSLVLWQLFSIKNRRGYDQSSAKGVQAMITESEKSDLEIVKFVTESKFEKAVFLTIFNPSENEHFLHLLRIKQIRIPCIGQDKLFCAHTHLIRSSNWPDWKMEMSSTFGGSIRGTNKKSDACEFNLEVVENRNLDNIFYIRSKKWPSYYVYVDRKFGWCWSVSGQPGPEGQWKVIKLEGTSGIPQYLMSPLQWPCYFIFMSSTPDGTVKGTYDLRDIKEKGLWEILDI
ncbi:uncharacterized protein LOC133186387 [Saccostrea echinata]|uniref:uncharacterized protein LOC133186387 n=1 Tax=Saccostrea echinata TaxID=191078 RepID=UPI002A82D743|nr:uncharacterized protein LOC133186387 [Saccostrea echinata]